MRRVASQGKTGAEALANLKEAAELHLESFPKTRLKPAKITQFELAHV